MSVIKRFLEIKSGVTKSSAFKHKRIPKEKNNNPIFKSENKLSKQFIIVNVIFDDNKYYAKGDSDDYTGVIEQAKLKYAYIKHKNVKGTIQTDGTINWRVTNI